MGFRTSKSKTPKHGGEAFERVVLAIGKHGCAPELKTAGGYLQTIPKKTGCLYEVVLTKRVGQLWELIVAEHTHNHELSLHPSAHTYLRRKD
jgi:hypothetical protein